MKIDLAGLLSVAIVVGLAIFGATAKAIRLSEHQKITPKDFAKGLILSAFIGLVGYMICNYIGADGLLTYIIVSVAGYTGPATIDKLGEILMAAIDMIGASITKKK